MPTRTVWGHGPKDCKIAFVGEAPGIEELKRGENFVGKAGRVFTDCTRRAGINRELCYITNVFKQMPKGGSVSIWARINNQGRFIGSKAYDEYREILKQELSDVNANVIVPLGAIPYYTLTGFTKPGITTRRGSIVSSLPDFGSRKVIGTIHPSAVERGVFKYKHYITMDMARAKHDGEFPELRLPERHMVIEPTFNQCMEYLDEIYAAKQAVGFDIEVVDRELACFAFARTHDDVICIPLTGESGHYFNERQEHLILKRTAEILGSQDIPILGQNLIFDMSFIYKRYKIITRNFHDTMVAQKIVNPDFPAGLHFLCSIFTREPYYKDEGKIWADFLGDVRRFWVYNCKDAAVLLEIFPKLMRHIKRQGNEETYITQLATLNPLMYLGLRGLRCDIEAKESELKRESILLEELERQWEFETGQGVSITSPKQLMEYYYEGKKYKKFYLGRGAKKKLTMNVDAIKDLAKRYADKSLYILRAHRLKNKYVGTYLKMALDNRGRLITAINPVGTKNGRISANKDPIDEVGGNLQTMPHRFRRFVMADQGYLMLELDLSMGENRCVAYFAPEWNMIRAFENGIDLHKQTAALIFGSPYEEVTTKDFTCPIGDGTHSQRFWGKRANHGLNYGEGYKKFALVNELLERESKAIVDRYHRAYPGVKQYQAWVEEHLRQNKCTIRNPFGRLRTFHDRFAQEMKNSAYNFLPQSTIADVINRWGLNFMYANSNPGQVFEKCELLLQTHDSLTVQIPLFLGWKYMALCVCALRASLEQKLTWMGRSWFLPVDLQVGFNAGPCDKRRYLDNGSMNLDYNPLGLMEAKCHGTVDEVAGYIEDTYSKLITT